MILLSLSLLGCDAIYRILDENGAQEKALVGDYIPYQSNSIVRDVQALLKVYGYNPGKVDGILGTRTRNAIQRFQEDQDLEVTRFIDEATWELMNEIRLKGFVVDEDLNIVFIQEVLKATGFNPGQIDGKFGKQTTEALKAFQTSHGLENDGKIGFKTLRALASYVVLE